MSGPIIGNYRIDKRLGSGTFATVWLAWDPDLERHVAIKVLADNWSADEDIRRRFLLEARILWRLDNPRVVRVFLTGTLDDGRPYFVMEYADAGTLLDRIRARKEQRKPFSIIEAVTFSQEIADGLIVAHARDIVHRDLKPSNILFSSVKAIGDEDHEATDRLLIADFGIARQLEQASRMTVSAGTPFYMAPEQANPTPGNGPNQRADVYSAATILYELLTGTVPYPFETISQIVRAQEIGARPSLRRLRPDVSEGLAHVIDTGLESNQEHRYASAREWKDALTPFATATVEAGETKIWQDVALIEAQPLPQEQRPPKPKDAARHPDVFQRYRKLPAPPRYGLGAVILLLLAAGFWKFFLQPSPTPPPVTPTESALVATAASTQQDLPPTPTLVATQPPQLTNATLGSPEAIQRLENNFSLIQTGNCTSLPLVEGTDAIVRCVTSGATVTYREYTSPQVLQLDEDFINSTYNPTATTWHFGTTSNAPTEGTIYQYLDSFGDANLFWTVDSQNMSGEAVAADGDQSALHSWWINVGGLRPSA